MEMEVCKSRREIGSERTGAKLPQDAEHIDVEECIVGLCIEVEGRDGC